MRLIATAGVVAAGAVLASSALGAGNGGACSTEGLSASSVRVVELRVQGVSCLSARKVAGRVAQDLQHGREISVRGSSSFAISQSTCTGCKAATSVSIGYSGGSVTISLRGGTVSSSTTPSMPTLPSPGGSGAGTVI
jgi:hypothetical protein